MKTANFSIMSQNIINTINCLLFALIVTSCAGSGDSYKPSVDLKGNNYDEVTYNHNLKECQEVAKAREYLSGNTQNHAIEGTAVGAGLGASGGDLSGLAAGAVVGGLVGAGLGVSQVTTQKEEVIVKCLQDRGYKVIM